MSLTVHNYARNSTLDSQDKLLTQGRNLVQAALSSSDWRNLSRFQPQTKSTTVYRFAYTPPSKLSPKVGAGIKEWDSVVTQDEIFTLNDLDDFVNTDFSSIFIDRKSDPQLLSSAAEKHEMTVDSASEPHPKRRKLETGALYGFIPKPHIYPSPFCPSLSPPKGKPFQKTEPIYILPNVSFSLPDDARVAWLIPIRGAFPWENCTSGAFLDASHIIPTPSSPILDDDQISWTRGSILEFWDFLLRLRQVGKLGPLGVSFNCSSAQSTRVSPAATDMEQQQQIRIHPGLINGTTDTLPYLQETRANLSLSMVDYIKVYHDATCRLFVRSALDAWSYEVRDTDGCVKKIRLLKGARLVLVDACSRGIQIS